ncbi:hypothetical protein N0V84_010326, partial [Fusarium piperis]
MAEDQRRVSRIKTLLGRRLQDVYRQLPAEVCLMIAGELVREFAAMTTAELWRTHQNQGHLENMLVPILVDVRAQYIYIDGVRYLKTVSPSPSLQGTQILDPATAWAIDTIHVLEDHLGIRQILFSTAERSVELSSLLSSPVKDAWWRNIPFSAHSFFAISDGVKLRAIEAVGTGYRPVPSAAMEMESQSAYKEVAWSRPMYPAHEPVLRYWQLNSEQIMSDEDDRGESLLTGLPTMCALTRRRFRIASLDFNDPAVTGYSVCFASGIRGIYVHRGGEDLVIYDDIDMYTRDGIWMHMPVDRNERISAIWIRSD